MNTELPSLAMRPGADGDRAATAAIATTVLLWASSFVAIRSAGHHFGPGALALGRLLAGSAVLGVMAVVRREGLPPRAAWPGIAGFGVLWFGVYMVALNWGEQKVDAGTASMTTSSIPLMVVVLSGLLLGEGFPRRLLGGIAVSGTGTVLVGLSASQGGRAPLAGVLLCVLAAAGAACAQIGQKPALRYASALQVTTFGCLTGTAVTIPFAGQFVREFAAAPADATLSVLYLGVFPTALGFTTWAFALARGTAGRTAAAIYLIPAIVVVLSWLLLNEVPRPLSGVGGALCLAGVAITRRRWRSPRARVSAVSR